ncbi:MAG: acylneuraminate cytidylyltransferase family protein [Pseudomonadota bacterium]
MIIGHIGVRGGSKGVPGKNLRPLCGKPLLQWSLEHLRDHPRVDHLVLSTDDPEMHALGQDFGCLDIGLRPTELAQDTSSKWEVWQHSLSQVEDLFKLSLTAFVDLDATCPLRDLEDIGNALSLFEREAPDMVMSVTPARKNPYFNLVEPGPDGGLQVSKKLPGNVVSRQEAPTVYEHAGPVYVVAPSYLKSAGWLYEGRVLPYVMPAERCFDIDDPFDFKLVEWLMSEKLKARSRPDK